MARVGRRWKPTAKDRATVKTMTGYGISQLEICAVLGITKPTLEKRCRLELDTGAADANAQVAASMFRMATKGPLFGTLSGCEILAGLPGRVARTAARNHRHAGPDRSHDRRAV